MDPNHLTQKSHEALAAAQQMAQRTGRIEVDVEDLLLALLEQRDGIVPRLLARSDVDVATLMDAVQQHLASRPSVSGPGASGEVRMARTLARLLDIAEKEAERLKDDYVSVEHLLLAMLSPDLADGGRPASCATQGSPARACCRS